MRSSSPRASSSSSVDDLIGHDPLGRRLEGHLGAAVVDGERVAGCRGIRGCVGAAAGRGGRRAAGEQRGGGRHGGGRDGSLGPTWHAAAPGLCRCRLARTRARARDARAGAGCTSHLRRAAHVRAARPGHGPVGFRAQSRPGGWRVGKWTGVQQAAAGSPPLRRAACRVRAPARADPEAVAGGRGKTCRWSGRPLEAPRRRRRRGYALAGQRRPRTPGDRGRREHLGATSSSRSAGSAGAPSAATRWLLSLPEVLS